MHALRLIPMMLAMAATPAPVPPAPDLANVRAFAVHEGEALWPGYGHAPFGFLLLEPKVETLLCDRGNPAGFSAAVHDPATGCERRTRPRSTLPGNLLAAMPMFGDDGTIVMGTPAATGRTRSAWLRTILHEHFHQYQYALPGHDARVAALDLAGADTGGMWMLNYPFPYASAPAARAHAAAARALLAAIEARGTSRFLPAFDHYLAARHAFAASVDRRAWRYFEFELWQEGVARWTELELGSRYPDPRVRAATAALLHETIQELRAPDLARDRRVAVYATGAGEAMLLQACASSWRSQYPEALALRPLLERARANCAGTADNSKK